MSGSSLNVGAIVAGAVVGFLVLLLVAAGLAYFCYSRSGSSAGYAYTSVRETDDYELY